MGSREWGVCAHFMTDTVSPFVRSWVIGHFVWTLQKAENKTKATLDSGKVDQMTEVIPSSRTTHHFSGSATSVDCDQAGQ